MNSEVVSCLMRTEYISCKHNRYHRCEIIFLGVLIRIFLSNNNVGHLFTNLLASWISLWKNACLVNLPPSLTRCLTVVIELYELLIDFCMLTLYLIYGFKYFIPFYTCLFIFTVCFFPVQKYFS